MWSISLSFFIWHWLASTTYICPFYYWLDYINNPADALVLFCAGVFSFFGIPYKVTNQWSCFAFSFERFKWMFVSDYQLICTMIVNCFIKERLLDYIHEYKRYKVDVDLSMARTLTNNKETRNYLTILIYFFLGYWLLRWKERYFLSCNNFIMSLPICS